MKILAVIPARAGSKGIPNKNIRLINGKPLIAYCIENALKSKYITDILITTDSEEIGLIANYYNIPYITRNPALCADNVTLDAVVYDACKSYQGDCIVTLQPTSPTLQVATLDAAIEYFIENDRDTLISVVNKPHLAWIEKDGKKVPDYEKRLNRQYLPQRYLETGAFMISKASVVNENSRIGQNVDVYEISETEAVDIDSFQDLVSAEHILRQKKMAIVVNGNNTIGLGHISRMMEFADQFYEKPDFYFDSNITSVESFGQTTYRINPFSTEDMLIQMLEQGKYQIVINDILDTSLSYMQRVKEAVPKVVNFEDSGEGRKVADLVINALYDENSSEYRLFCGEKYYLIPKLFVMYKPIQIKDHVERIFICFGGADPQNYTEMTLELISEKKYYQYQFVVVLGRAKNGYKDLISKYNKGNIKVLYDVKNMPELMTKCDVAITSMGRTCYEVASLGIPTLAIAQNKREERHTFVSEKNGFIKIPFGAFEGQIKTAIDRMFLVNAEERKKMQDKMLVHDLKRGRERVKNLIDSL